ncbi:hypothetical protein GCM10010915_17490 [Microbacterium faecale]|uniref:PadR family transcriptional regulator n=1 Tax=Microbacterium faecale TaxID=1804630 RepID=A0A917DGU7_9MICO|nr:PadR family transcriptional regulator [Microbacterium faecale]GGD37207.1 hypothetical protein GCM10010915_17490 [Microbacterium faecale]HJB62828.1 PadR family transcriptional regulator [Candidatus Microbacterium pullistercoris]
MTDKPLNTTAASLLGMLHDGPLSGWDLVAKAEDEIGAFWSLTRSQVYRELKTLSERGLIEAGRAGARDRRPYSLTGDGRAAFQEWLATEPQREVIRYPLLLRLRFGRFLSAEQIAALIRDAHAEHSTALESYFAERAAAEDAAARGVEIPGVDDFTLAVLDLGIRYEQAMVDWLALLPERIDVDGAANGSTAE